MRWFTKLLVLTKTAVKVCVPINVINLVLFPVITITGEAVMVSSNAAYGVRL